MNKKKYMLINILIIYLLIISNAYAKTNLHEKYMGEDTVQVGDIWIINTPANFDATNCMIIERYKNNGIRFTQIGDTIVTAYYWDQTNPYKAKLYSQKKFFHVVSSDQYGNSIRKNISKDAYLKEILLLLNKKRAENGLKPLILDNDLCYKAQIRAQQISITLGVAEFLIMDGKPTILKDKNYKFIDEISTFGKIGLYTPIEFTSNFFGNNQISLNDSEVLNKLLNKKANYFGMGLVVDTQNNYYWSFLFADRK